MQAAFYDPNSSYEENYTKGPPIFSQNITPPQRKGSKIFKFLGFDLSLPFGIPAGPLLNSQFMKAAFAWGYDVSTYKTVRAESFPSHPFPNVLFVDVEGELHPDKTLRLHAKSQPQSENFFSITNSFGVPSKEPSFWQQDIKKALLYPQKNQLMIVSFMGTVKKDQTQEQFIDDFAQAARLANKTGAKVLEANLSCPNIGNEGLVCYNLPVTKLVTQAIRKAIGNTPLILKVGYYKNEKDIEELAKITNMYAQAVAAINTLQVEVIDDKGNQALPGNNRLKSGICGASIKWAGIEMVKKLKDIKNKNKYTYEIAGIGGVMTPDDYFEYRKAGANLVQSATGAMWNPYLAYEIWKKENSLS